MPELEQRLYTLDDLPRLRDLWRQAYAQDAVARREKAFRWVTEGNPLAPGGSPRHLILDGDRVIGSLGRMPIRYRLAGRPVEMHYSHDLLVDPGYRGHGLGKKLVRAVAAAAPSIAGGLWMTDPCYELHKRCGWAAVREFRGHRLVLDAGAALRRRTGNAALARLLAPAARAWMAISRPRVPRVRDNALTAVERFDERVDDLLERCARRFHMIAERTHRFLNWKYVDSPNVAYERWILEGNGGLDAYVALRVDRKPDGRRNGLVVDFLADPEAPEAFDTLAAFAVERLRSGGAQVAYWLTTVPAFRARLEAIGFRVAPHRHTFVITGHEELEGGGDRLLDSTSWFMTHGESDGDMWADAQTWAIDRQATRPAGDPAASS